MNQAPRHEERADHRADVRAAVENARGERAFAFGKPFGDGFDRGWEISRLADAEGAPHEHVHPRQAADEGVRDSKNRPDDERQGEAELCADFVNDPASKNCHARVKTGEHGGDVGEIRVRPAEAASSVCCGRGAKKFFQVTDDLSVHVVDRRGKKEQRADDPAKVA